MELHAEAEQRKREDILWSEGDSRAKSVWPEENNKIAIVLSSNHQFKIPEHILNRKRRCHKQGIVRQTKDPIE